MIEKNQYLYDSPNNKGFNIRHRQKLLFSAPPPKQSEKTQNSYPPQRINHASVFYKNKIYVIGGTIKNYNSKTNPLYLYAYELEVKKWRRFLTKTTSKQFVNLSGQSNALMGNRWFLWGGVDGDQNCVSQLWKLNLENYQWVKCEQKGDIPYANEGGLLIGHEKNWLLHYQGINYKSNRNEHYAYIYSIQSKNWFQCKGNYQWTIKYRIGASICSQNNKIYLFGGLRILQDDVEYLNDFYEITVHHPSKTSDAILNVKKIDTSFNISARSQAFLFPFGKQTICLLGGRNQSQFHSNLCIFNVKNKRWIQDNYFQTKLIQRTGVSCVQGGQQFFIFGGGIEQMNSLSFMNDLWSLKISWERLNHLIEDNCDEYLNNQCEICLEKRMNFMFIPKDSSSQMIIDYKRQINFSFSAFALLLDNSFLLGANKIIIHVEKDDMNHNYITIQDDGKNTWSPQQFLSSMLAYCSINSGIMTGCDKKIRKNIQRSNQLKQFGVNIKLGSLRLGKIFLYITDINHEKHVFLCIQTTKTPEEQQEKYCIYYYSFNTATKVLSQQQMAPSKDYIQAEYKKYILYAMTSSSSMRNHLFIFDTILDNPEQQIKIRPQKNDIYLGSQQVIRQIQHKGYNLADCIDISLRSYLSSLYLKNQAVIYLSLKQALLINMQSNLQIIDKLCKSGCAIQLDGLIQFDFKMAEFYYLRQAKKSNSFFSNGVLLYYRNRLISRYKVQLGEMIYYLKDNHDHSIIKLPMIGFADLPENVPVNASKTAFVFSVMLEKMYSRFKFVEETFSMRSKLFLPTVQLPQPKPKKSVYDDNEYEASDINVNNEDKRQRRAKKSKKRRSDNFDDYQSHIRKIHKKDQKQQMSHSILQNISAKNIKVPSYNSEVVLEEKNSQLCLQSRQGVNAQNSKQSSSNLLKQQKDV